MSGDCVEVASFYDAIAIRDSKNRRGPMLTVSPDTWRKFLTWLKDMPPDEVRVRDQQPPRLQLRGYS